MEVYVLKVEALSDNNGKSWYMKIMLKKLNEFIYHMKISKTIRVLLNTFY